MTRDFLSRTTLFAHSVATYVNEIVQRTLYVVEGGGYTKELECAAKRILFRRADVEMLASPSENLVLTDSKVAPMFAATDRAIRPRTALAGASAV